MAVKRTRSNILSNKGYIGLTGGVTNGDIDTLTAAVGEVKNNYLTATVGKRFNTATGLHYRQDTFIPSSRTDVVIKTWTRPKNVRWVEVLLVGGGGSGGSGRASQAVSSSGGGGGGAVLYTRVYVADYDTWYVKCGLGAGQNNLNQNSSNFNSWGKPGTSSIFSPIPIIWSYRYEVDGAGLNDTSTLSGPQPTSMFGNSANAEAVRGARYHGLHVPGGGGGGHPAGGIGQPMGAEGGASRGRRNKLLSAGDGGPLSDGRFSRDNVFWGPGGYGGLGSNGDPAVSSNVMGGGGGGGASERGRSGDTGAGGRGGNGVTWLGLNVGGGGGGGRNAGNAGAGVFGGGNGGGSGGDGSSGTGGGGGGGSNGTSGRGGHGTVVIRYWV